MSNNPTIHTLQILFVTVVLLFILAVVVIMVLYSRKRAKNDRMLADALGFMAQKSPPPDLIYRIKAAYQTSTRVKVMRVSKKKTPDEEIYLCDVSYCNMRAENGEVEYRTVCIISNRLHLPFFLMLYQFDKVYGPAGHMINNMLKLSVRLLGMQEIAFSNQPEFAKKYQVYGYKEHEIRNVFNAGLLQDLCSTDNWLIRAEGDCICFNDYNIRRGKMITREELIAHIDHARQFVSWLS